MTVAAGAGPRPRRDGCALRRVASPLGRVALTFGLLLGGSVAAEAQSGDTTPAGMIAFFLTSGSRCPVGWSVPSKAQGRILVGVSDPKAVGGMVGTPLQAEAEPLHEHKFSTTVSVGHKGIAAIACCPTCCNEQAAGGGSYAVPNGGPGTTDGGHPETTNLPFIQLVICRKD